MVLLGDRMKRSPARFENMEPGKYALRVMLPEFDPIEARLELGDRSGARTAGIQVAAQQGRGGIQLAAGGG